MANSDYGAIPLTLAESTSEALNTKLGVTTGFKPSEWPEAIASIPTGGGLDKILTTGVISDTSNYRTATFDDISDYDTVIVRIYNPYNDTISFNEKIIKVSDIPDSGLSLNAVLDPNNVDCKIDKTSIRATYYRGAYRYIYADIVGSIDPLFPEVNI